MVVRKKKTSTSSLDKHQDHVTRWAKEVVSGEFLAGPDIRNACKRHLKDLETGHERGLYFDLEAANRAISFFPKVLRLSGGDHEGKPFQLLDWQAFIVGSLFGWKAEDHTRRFRMCYVESGKGSGKSPLAGGVGLYGLVADNEASAEVYAAAPLALDTAVPTPKGWTTQGKLKVGDQVFDHTGKPCNVTYLSPILYNRKCYEIEFDDGTVIISDANHRWETIDTRGQKPSLYAAKVVTTAEISTTLRSPSGRLRHRIEIADALKVPAQKLPIDPYTLGVWLGDGRVNRGAICHHKDDIEHLALIKSAGYELSSMKSQGDTCYLTILGLRTQLRGLGLIDNKHVPDIYLRASYQQRLSLLAGLMDTDGTCTKTGECRFTNREKRLAEAVHDLATGLGVKSNIHQIEVEFSPHYVVSFKAPKSVKVFHLSRKHARQIDTVDTRAKARYIRSVTPCKSVPVRCIEVDSTKHLYLVTKSHIATHNTKKDQAMILFRDAVSMVNQSPQLSSRLKKSGTGQSVWNLAYIAKNSFFRPISSDNGQSGPRPHMALIDEVHEHKNNNVVEMMRAGTKGRKQALIFMITNSGHDRTSVCYSYHEYGKSICAGTKEDDSFFAFICSLDEGDDPINDESCWPKANPSLGHTFNHKYLREQVTQAKGMPAKESIVRRLNFCQWVDSASPWLSSDTWTDCEDDIDINELIGEECYGGLDLSGTRDLTALGLYFPRVKTLLVEFWTPKDTLLDRERTDNVPYSLWEKQGFIHAPPGHAVDYSFVAERIADLSAQFDIKCIGFDQYRINYLEPVLVEANVYIPLVKHGQGYYKASESNLWMPRSIELFEKLITDKEIKIKINPCLRWNAASAVLEADAKDNRIFTKKKSTGRIDGVVAAAMAVGTALESEGIDDDEDWLEAIRDPIY
jgi:phage terminase large subunit-like protein